jgi:hypothetical protein
LELLATGGALRWPDNVKIQLPLSLWTHNVSLAWFALCVMIVDYRTEKMNEILTVQDLRLSNGCLRSYNYPMVQMVL